MDAEGCGCGFLTVLILLFLANIWAHELEKVDVYVKMPDGKTETYTVRNFDIDVVNWGRTTVIRLGNKRLEVATENVTVIHDKKGGKNEAD